MIYFKTLGWAGIAAASITLAGCQSTDNDDINNDDYAEAVSFMKMIGGNIDRNQTWVTGTVINAKVKTTGSATVNAYTLGKQERKLFASKQTEGSGYEQMKFDIPQGTDTLIAFEADYGDAQKVWRMMSLNTALSQIATIDLSRPAGTRAASSMAESNSVSNPNAALCGESNHSTENGYAGHLFGYTTFPGWVWDNIAVAVPESKKPDASCVTNYELISTGPFYLSPIYGNTGNKAKTTLGYYYYKESGKYDDMVMVDIMDMINTDYVDGYAKLQYQLTSDDNSTWHDANFDYLDGEGLTKNKKMANRPERRGDNAYNALLVNKEYDGKNGIQGVRGITFQVNVPVGYRLGFYLRVDGGPAMTNDQKTKLQSLGINQKYININKRYSFSNADLNPNDGSKPFRSIIKRYDGFTFMGLDDTPYKGDNDCNDVTFGLTPGNGGSLPGIVLPGVFDLDKDKFYNNDSTLTDTPKDDAVKDALEGKDPSENPADEVRDLTHWTIAYEDMGTVGDFDFNDFVIRVVPNTAHKAKLYVCATGGTIDAEFHYNGPSGDVNLGNMFKYMPAVSNVSGSITKEEVYVGEVDWPEGYTMPTDASRFYMKVKNGNTVAVSTQAGEVPHAICVAGDWRWPLEHVNLAEAYPMVGKWATNLSNQEARDWYNHPTDGKVAKFSK